jgi:zinc transport system ATP-binding protein
MSTAPAVITTQRACVTFDGDCVVDEVEMHVRAGEFIAVLGDNGAGKTTLMRALLGLVPLSHGSVDIHGVPLGRFREWQRIAYVPQRLLGSSSVPVSVLEAVRAARLRPFRIGPLSREDRDRVQRALEQVGLWDRRHDRLDTLSGGQQRRVMLARALASDADLFILDEPTAGVDAENQRRLADILRDLRDGGATILLVTHELGPLANLVSRVILMTHPEHTDEHRGGQHDDHHGSIAYDGPPSGLRHGADWQWQSHHHEDTGIRHSHGPLVDPVADAILEHRP